MQELIRSGSITDRDVCELLYDQGVLSKEDLDPCSGSAVVLEKATGKVLACVSYLGYDNNRLANEMDADYYNQLIGDGLLPLYNRATQQLSAPGSTFKPVTIIAELQEGVITSDTGTVGEIRQYDCFQRGQFLLSVIDKTADFNGSIEKKKVELSSRAELPESVWNTVQTGSFPVHGLCAGGKS